MIGNTCPIQQSMDDKSPQHSLSLLEEIRKAMYQNSAGIIVE
jgi:hypothetical protein